MKSIKRKLSLGLATGMILVGAATPVLADTLEQDISTYVVEQSQFASFPEYWPEDPNAIVTNTLPSLDTSLDARITGTDTVTVPRNVDGNQGREVYSARVLSNHEGGNFEVLVNSFRNMSDVNIAVYLGNDRIAERMNVASGSTVTFTVPARSAGSNIRVMMSSNTASGTASTFMEVRAR